MLSRPVIFIIASTDALLAPYNDFLCSQSARDGEGSSVGNGFEGNFDGQSEFGCGWYILHWTEPYYLVYMSMLAATLLLNVSDPYLAMMCSR